MQYYEFPQDQSLPLSVKTHLQANTSQVYENVHDILKMSCQAFGVNPDMQTQERWHRALSLSYALDQLLDESDNKTTAHAVFNNIATSFCADEDWRDITPSMVSPDDAHKNLLANTWAIAMRPTLVELNPNRRLRMADTLECIGYVAAQKSEATRIVDYIAASKAEGTLVASLFTDMLPDTVHQLPQINELTTWMRYIFWYAALGDNTTDFQHDIATKKIQVPFTQATFKRLKLARAVSGFNLCKINFGACLDMAASIKKAQAY